MENIIHILLADDDKDDCTLFNDALEELSLSTKLSTVSNGEQLLDLFNNPLMQLPDVLFLDLNMPRQNGFECLIKIKNIDRLKQLPVVIFSTSNKSETINLLYKNGARYFIRKPNDFTQLKNLIYKALTLTVQPGMEERNREKFVLSC